jgi:hypothetical protein
MKGESAQTQEPTNRMQSGKSEGERGKTQQTQEHRTEPGKTAQAPEPTNRTQSGKSEGERGKTTQTQERRTEPGKAAQTQEQRGQPETGRRAAQTGSAANQNRAGQAKTGTQNRNGAAQSGQSGKQATPQNVQATGKTNLPHDKAAKVAQTLMASGASSSENVNVNVSVGTNLPTTVVINPLPMTIVELVPEFRGYDYFVMGDEIVIVDPATRQVVEIIEDVG